MQAFSVTGTLMDDWGRFILVVLSRHLILGLHISLVVLCCSLSWREFYPYLTLNTPCFPPKVVCSSLSLVWFWYCISFCPRSSSPVFFLLFDTRHLQLHPFFLSLFLPHSSLSSSSIPSLMSGSDWTISSFIVVFDLFLIPSPLSLVFFSFLILAFCPLMKSLCLTRMSFVVVILLHCYSCWSLVLFFVSREG